VRAKRKASTRAAAETSPAANNELRSTVLGVLQQFSGQENIVSTPLAFVTATGSLNRAVVLNQIVFWHGIQTRKGREGWFFKTYDEWERETGLGEFKIRSAADWLERQHVIERRLKKAHGAPTLHYRLADNFTDWILEKLKNRILRNSRIPVPAETQESITDHSSELTNRLSPLPPGGGMGDVVVFPVKNKTTECAASDDPNYADLMEFFIQRGGRTTKKQQRALRGLLERHDPVAIRQCFEFFFTLPNRQYAVTWATVEGEIDQWLLRHGFFADTAEQIASDITDQPMRTIKEQIEHGQTVATERGFNSGEFLEAWGVFVEWRAAHNNPVTPAKVTSISAQLAPLSETEAIAVLRHLLPDGWRSEIRIGSDGDDLHCAGCGNAISQGQHFAERGPQSAHVGCLGMVAVSPAPIRQVLPEVAACHA
jgi:hypothetical protein